MIVTEDLLPYQFIDDGPEDVLSGVVAIDAPIPICDVPSPALLFTAWERCETFAEAFEAWARAILPVKDAPPSYWALQEAIGKVLVASSDMSINTGNDATRRKLFIPLRDAGWTMRQMAERLQLSLSDVVSFSWASCMQLRAEELCDVEDDLVANGCPRFVKPYVREHPGIGIHTVRSLCRVHQIPYKGRMLPRERVRR